MITTVLFDMDGVISDTQKLHAAVESELLSDFDIHLSPEEISKKYSGVKTGEFFVELLNTQSKAYDIDSLMNKKWEMMQEMAQRGVDAVPGSIALIQRLRESGFPLAVASASNLAYVESVLRALNVRDAFGAIVSGDMVTNGKPDPESFLLAAQKLQAAPADCLVIEDGRSGMEAAKRAGMYCIGLVKDNDVYPTTNTVTSLDSITIQYVHGLE
jgi:beta-phosphoglucomutase